jgi:DNA repair and recombination protein RAD52
MVYIDCPFGHKLGKFGPHSHEIVTDAFQIDLQPNGQYSISITAIVRITLADGCFHEDVGNGSGDMKQKTAALEKVRAFIQWDTLTAHLLPDAQAQKEAVTDATKRALRAFGNLLGNCLYDKEYAKEVAKINVPKVCTISSLYVFS